MKTFIYFIFTCFISTGAFFAAMNTHNPFPAFAVAFGHLGRIPLGLQQTLKSKIRKTRPRTAVRKLHALQNPQQQSLLNFISLF